MGSEMCIRDRNEGRPFLRPQRCAALWLGLHTQLLQDVTNNAWTGSWALLRYEGLSHSALTDAAEILNVNSSRFTSEPSIDDTRVWATNTTWGDSPFASGACQAVSTHAPHDFVKVEVPLRSGRGL